MTFSDVAITISEKVEHNATLQEHDGNTEDHREQGADP